MRVLFCSTGGDGHVQPMRPLAAALRERGHAVAWVTAPDAHRLLAGQGITLYCAGRDIAASRLLFRRRHPELLGFAGEAASASTFPRLFGSILAPDMLAGIGRAIDDWRPALVVAEAAALAAPLACEQRGVPCVAHAFGLPVPAAHLEAAMHCFGPRWSQAGLRPPVDAGLYRHLYIDIVPPPLTGRRPVPAPRLALNPYRVRRAGSVAVPDALRRALAPTGRRRIYLSFGTVFNRAAILADAAGALARTGAEVVVTTGRVADRSGFPVLPNLHVLDFVDPSAVLPRCDLVVSHGGAGTVLAAAAHGLPQLVLPQGADHFRNAGALAGASAAIVVTPERQTAVGVLDALDRLMCTDACASAARRLARAMARMPSARDVADELDRRFGAD